MRNSLEISVIHTCLGFVGVPLLVCISLQFESFADIPVWRALAFAYAGWLTGTFSLAYAVRYLEVENDG